MDLEGLSIVAALAFAAFLCWRIYIAWQELQAARQGTADQIGHTLILERSARLAELPTVARPSQCYSRSHARFLKSELGSNSSLELLDLFERRMMEAATAKILFFAAVAPGKRGNVVAASFVIGKHMGFFTNLLGWIEIYERGPYLEWHFVASESRFWKYASEEASHFGYDRDIQRERYNTLGENPGILYFVWDLFFSGFTSDAGKKQAEWFQSFVLHVWSEAVETACMQAIQQSSPVYRASMPNSVGVPTPPRRPIRRI